MTRKAKAMTGRPLDGDGPAGQPEHRGGNPEKRLRRDNRSAAKGIPRSASGATRDAGQPVHHYRNFAVAYLNVLIDDADQEELIAALGRIARLSGGERLVEKVELNAPALYRTLCRRGNPELKSVATLLKAMGIRMALQPLAQEMPSQLPHARRFTRPDEEGAFL
jgi:probable addiction module antidote protein